MVRRSSFFFAFAISGGGVPSVASGAEGAALPLYKVSEKCSDRRYPALAGPWVVGCGSDGRVDRVLSLDSGRFFMLPLSFDAPALGPSVLYSPGISGGLIFLSESGPQEAAVTMVHGEVAAPAGVDSSRVVVLSEAHVQAFLFEETRRQLYEAHPAGWYPPALAWPWVAWVDDASGDEDILALDLSQSHPQVTVLAGGAGHQRHVVGHEHWLAWVEDTRIVLLDTRTNTQEETLVTTGFSSGPTLYRGILCWEEMRSDIDIQCSDGVSIAGAGHQRWPSRWGQWLIYREDNRVMLYTIAEDVQ